MQAAGTTGSAENTRHSPRNGWNGCFAFSPVLRAFWPPLPARRGKRHSKRDTSVGVSGPRDLTVRINVVRRRRTNPRCNIDTPTASRLNVRDDREAPLLSRRDRHNQSLFLIKRKKNILARRAESGDAFDPACKISFLVHAVFAPTDLTLAGESAGVMHFRRQI
jgi:hypothetical protein